MKVKNIKRIVSALLCLALCAQCLWAAAEGSAAENLQSETQQQYIIPSGSLTETEYPASGTLFSKYGDFAYESNSADAITYNERGETEFTYFLSGELDNVNGSLELAFRSSDSELGNKFCSVTSSASSDEFQSTEQSENFLNSVYGFGAGWGLSVPQIEYVNPTVAYFHMGDGSAYRIAKTCTAENSTLCTYKLCGYPYSYEIRQQGTENSDGGNTVTGFIATDRYGSEYHFDLNGRLTSATAQDGTVFLNIGYDSNGKMNSYSDSQNDYYLLFERTTDSNGVNVNVKLQKGDNSKHIATLTLRDGRLVQINKLKTTDSSTYSTATTGYTAENIATTVTTESQEDVSFEYSVSNNAVLINSRSTDVSTSLDGYKAAELSGIARHKITRSSYSYAAINADDAASVSLAQSYNTTNTAYSSDILSEYTVSTSSSLENFAAKSNKSYKRLNSVVCDITDVTNAGYDPTDEGNTSETNTSPTPQTTNSRTTRTLTYTNGLVTKDEYINSGDSNSKEVVNYSYAVDSAVSQKALADVGETVKYMQTVTERTYSGEEENGTVTWTEEENNSTPTVTARNSTGDIVYTKSDNSEIYYGYNQNGSPVKEERIGGLTYSYTYNNYEQLTKTQFDIYTVNYSNGNITGVDVGGRELTGYEYIGDKLNSENYANGQSLLYNYNEKGNITEAYSGAKTEENKLFAYEYDNSEQQKLLSQTNIREETKTEYAYSGTEDNEVVTATVYDISEDTPHRLYSYSCNNNGEIVKLGDTQLSTVYSETKKEAQDENGETEYAGKTAATSFSNSALKVENDINAGDNQTATVVKNGSTVISKTQYEYGEDDKVKSETTGITDADKATTSYEYDEKDNITAITTSAGTASYIYDSNQQLVRVNDQAAGKTYVFVYDERGNIQARKEYAYTTAADVSGLTPTKTDTFTYYSNAQNNWQDELATVNGTAVTYDASGNPLTFGDMSFTWKNGRQLAEIQKGTDTISYIYDDCGIRTSKTVNGVTTNYITSNGIIKAEYNDSYSIVYLYDEKSSIIGFVYTDKTSAIPTEQTYIYRKNMSGDIVGILDSNGTEIVKYTYDVWGKVTSISGTAADTLGILNPMRYRGYYLDNESELYYVISRYYDSLVGRWLSPEPNVYKAEFDENAGFVGYNVYAYCANSPIIYTDKNGESITLACVLIGAGVGLVVGGAFGAHRANKKGYSPKDGWKYWKYVVGYGVTGGAIGALVGWGASALIAQYGVATAASSITKGGGARFSSFNALKRSLGSAGRGKQWHHIVEQCQISKSGFSKYWIQNSNNVINISNSVHTKISAYYSSIQSFTNGMTFRKWLAGQSFKKQYEWGIKVLRMFGVKI